MCFPRKVWLGRYSGNREQWRAAYRDARIASRGDNFPDPKKSGIEWKAQLIVGSRDRPHPSECNVKAKLFIKRLIDDMGIE